MIDKNDALAAWELAPTLCHPEHGCSDYHRVWGLLRWLMPASSIFSAEAIADSVLSLSRPNCRVLLCGAADPAVLSVILDAASQLDPPPQVDVIERCATACEVIRRFADRRCAQVNVIQADFTADDTRQDELSGRYDVVIAHNILGHIPSDLRLIACARWAALAKENGLLLLVQTLCESDELWISSAADHKTQQLMQLELALQSKNIGVGLAGEITETAERFWNGSWRKAPALRQPCVESLLTDVGLFIDGVDFDTQPTRGPASLAINAGIGRSRALFQARKIAPVG